MNWAFVDYENVRSLESVNLASYQRVFIFCGPQNKSLKFDELPAAGISHIDLVAVPTSSKNNVDFHLAFHLGVQHGAAADGISFHVISNDKGYQGLINHLELLGRSCKLVEPNLVKKATAKKAVAKKSTSKADADATAPEKARSRRAKSVSAASGASAKTTATATINAATAAAAKSVQRSESGTGTAGKTSTNKESVNKAKTSNTAKARTVTKIKIKANRAAALSDAASKLFAQLQISGSNRPKTKARVLSWLKSHVKSLHMQPEPSPDSIFDEWSAAGMLSLSGSTVRYPDA